MLDYTFSLCLYAFENSGFVPAALVVSSLNLLVQITFSIVFGSKGLPKIRGYRGD